MIGPLTCIDRPCTRGFTRQGIEQRGPPVNDERAVQEVLARYVRETDRRDGAAQGALFTDDAVVQIFARAGEGYEKMGEPLIGGAGVQYAVENFMGPHPEGGTSHHVTTDHIIDVDGDSAHLNAQYVMFEIRTTPEPSIRPAESGYYDTDLRRIDGVWKIVRHHVLGDLPLGARP
ncbi:nuclear transport factor 2 family protein [Amycolatopsis sp. NPDC005232]|uniref:nuclear transport factor 2 family protein n=1 Tax=Amycolatopsis sp. NPDC005232 TaxID=3157027 RepID=UPI0033BF04F0